MSIAINHYAASVQGDREAFGEIVRQYQNLVSAVTYSITGNRQESEDLAQETFLTAWKNLPELREVEKLPAWLCGIARNLANNWIRRTQIERQNRRESALEAIPAAESSDESNIAESEREERIALLWATLKKIPLQFREPLVMYYQQNQSVVDIASALEISEANVRQRIARGRKYLKAEVERQVEKTLAHIRLSEHFTVAVLAALPIALTGEQVLAAGAAGATAAQSASSGGAGAGASFVAGIAAFFNTFLGFVLSTIFVGLGIALGIWSGIRNAPTLRARQWMIKVTLVYVIVGSIFFLLVMLAIAGINYAIVDHRLVPERAFLRNVCLGIHLFLVGGCPLVLIVSSYLTNRQWRTIVGEEMVGNRPPGGRQSTSLRSLYIWGGIALFTFLFAVATILLLGQLLLWPFFCVISIVLLFGISLFFYAVQISKDQESFAKYPPRLPNLLAILTGEEKAPKGFRNRINFWGDLTGIGWGLFVIHFIFFGFYFHFRYAPAPALLEKYAWSLPLWDGSSLTIYPLVAILTPIFVFYLLFVLFFAGIPRRRYWGMIFLGVTALISDVIMCGWFFRSMTLQIHRTGMIFLFGLSAWYLLCFTLLGAAGLWVFRRKELGVRMRLLNVLTGQ